MTAVPELLVANPPADPAPLVIQNSNVDMPGTPMLLDATISSAPASVLDSRQAWYFSRVRLLRDHITARLDRA